MLSIRKDFPILVLTYLLMLLPMQQSQADSTSTRTALTQATLELQRDLLLTQEKYLTEHVGLNFYLDIDKSPTNSPDSISINQANKPVFKRDLGNKQTNSLEAGGIQKLGAIKLAPGKHEFEILLEVNGQSLSKTIKLEKHDSRDNLKLTISYRLKQHDLKVIIDHETWAAAQ